MRCDECLGIYKCCYVIQLPWTLTDGTVKSVCVDKCLLPEILTLWENGIRTTGCCCGHGQKAYIGVEPVFIDQMIALGYTIQFNVSRPGDYDTFNVKTAIDRKQIF